MQVAHVMAQRSLCDRDQVGAVVVSTSNRIVDTGYNGPPRGMPRDEPEVGCRRWCMRGASSRDTYGQMHEGLNPLYDDCHSIHAEANALLFGERTQREGGTIYITSGVCGACAKLIANSGLKRVVCDMGNHAPHRNSGEWFAWLRLCGVECVEVGR
jgi:dCMP deaminase